MEQIVLTQSQLNMVILISLWALPWKGIALWKASQNKQKVWFIVLLLLNTIGILEILYIFILSKVKKQTAPELPKQTPPTETV